MEGGLWINLFLLFIHLNCMIPVSANHKGMNDVKHAYDHPRFQCISNENIRAAIDLADGYFADNGVEENSRIRGRLFLEDMLLQYQKQDAAASFELILARSLRRVIVVLLVKGQSFNVLEADKDAFIQAPCSGGLQAATVAP